MGGAVTPWSKPAQVDHDGGWSDWPAPAKVNLFLHIVGRRDDGYHLLQTAFQLLDFGDTVRLRPRDDGRIVRLDPLPDVDPDVDLTVRAARVLALETGCSLGADIALDKRIPMGGGLGGGSSDAATVLVALDALWKTCLGTPALAAIGLALGADVPVFVRGASAWAEGIGEQLTPLDVPESWFVVVDPGVRVPTAALFQDPDLTRSAAHLTIPLFASGAETVNVFEPVVRERFPAVARALDWLQTRAPARLSGSGGCIFARAASRELAEAIVNECPAEFRAFTARGLATSPLHARVLEWREARV
ncbi:MAG: 4-(cytidine 5'-diphospho)-2-C-methyl-D-erythritol kinase [Dokdonella sp.]|uniref:4-(cytidine 5'-diphospho)-2-C-methyl-D-erythritol kinase n=1 Tax=Dokdonella sp. TaxID=2291710 RepID=UPI00326685D7